jgi:hypothetical protein
MSRRKQILQTGGDFSLVEAAAHVSFAAQNRFGHHFKCRQ